VEFGAKSWRARGKAGGRGVEFGAKSWRACGKADGRRQQLFSVDLTFAHTAKTHLRSVVA